MMKKTEKDTHLSTQTKKTTKNRPITKWLEDYIDIYGVRSKPVTESFIESLAQDYVSWALADPEAFRISMFYIKKGIPKTTFGEWIEKYPILTQAHEMVHEIIAHRRETVAIKYNPSNAFRMMPLYDKRWKEVEEWRASIKAETSDNQNVKYIVVPSFEEIKKDN